MRTFIVILFVLLSTTLLGQSPSYFVLGDEALEGVDIYDIIQDNNQNFLFATDQGIYKHDGYSYIRIENNEMKSASVFGFCKDGNGTIYCHNLSHQVFVIKNDRMRLFLEVPAEFRSSQYSLALLGNNHLLIQGKGILELSQDGKIVDSYTNFPFGIYRNPIYPKEDGSCISFEEDTQRLLTVRSGLATDKSIMFKNRPGKVSFLERFSWTNHKNSFYAIDRIGGYIYRLNEDQNEMEFLNTLPSALIGQSIRAYSIEDNIWIAGQSLGIYAFDEEFNVRNAGNPLYPGYFISNVFTDHEGNQLLGTFDHGVLVIPNFEMTSYSAAPFNAITSSCQSQDDRIFYGSSNGFLFMKSGNDGIHPIHHPERNKTSETLLYWEQRDALLTDAYQGMKLVNLVNNTTITYTTASLKCGAFIDETTALLGYNNALRKTIISKNNELISSEVLLRERVYSVAFDRNNKLIYAGTAEGLKTIDSNGVISVFSNNGKVVNANYLAYQNGKVIVGSKRQGVLILRSGKVIRQVPVEGQVMKIGITREYYFVQARSGFYIFDKNGNLQQVLNKSAGLRNTKIIDFSNSNETLSLVNSSGVQTIQIKNIFRPTKSLPIQFLRMKVNDKPSTKTRLSYDQRKIEFSFGVSTLRHKENVSYEVKIVGYDDEWRTLEYHENSITYNALPAGEYTFMVRSNNAGKRSELYSYKFSISAPFYLQWWFYAVIVVILFASTVLFYRQRLRIQQRKALQEQELNASKLTAIQSQMNPHFIFNSLNSIQDLVIQGDTENSYNYITKFANLVRKTLNYSDMDFIEFDQEIQLLELYLTLEKLRFKDDFDYTLSYDGVSDVLIPPMLIQPFIENALMHGLLHKEGHRQLNVRFALGEHLICTIEDNGIGRKKAQEIKERQNSSHESFAVKSIKRRLEILKSTFGDSIGITYEDLDNENSQGTRVTIRMPFQRTL